MGDVHLLCVTALTGLLRQLTGSDRTDGIERCIGQNSQQDFQTDEHVHRRVNKMTDR